MSFSLKRLLNVFSLRLEIYFCTSWNIPVLSLPSATWLCITFLMPESQFQYQNKMEHVLALALWVPFAPHSNSALGVLCIHNQDRKRALIQLLNTASFVANRDLLPFGSGREPGSPRSRCCIWWARSYCIIIWWQVQGQGKNPPLWTLKIMPLIHGIILLSGVNYILETSSLISITMGTGFLSLNIEGNINI